MKKAHKSFLLTGLVVSLFVSVSRLCHTTGAKFYWLLMVLVGGAVILAASLGIKIGTVEGGVYDSVMRHRLSSPQAAANVVILDVDERSLAKLAPEYGRWPWPREVIAQTIAELEEGGVAGLAVNIMFSDADLNNPDSDAMLDFVTAESSRTAYPMVRLPADNDSQSQLKAGAIPGLILEVTEEPTVAALLPFLAGMQAAMGINNLENDVDGIVRQAGVWHQDVGWRMPTLAGRMLQLSGVEGLEERVQKQYLNWRNKSTSYQRVSFADYFLALNGSGDFDPAFFQGKYVVLGASAPGISNLKPTPAKALMDDNEILATFIDDVLNDSHMRLLPNWLVVTLALAFIALLAALFSSKKAVGKLDFVFVVMEAAGVVILFVCVSYTNHFVDLTPALTAGLAYYSIARMYLMLDERVVSGAPEQFNYLSKHSPIAFSLFAYAYSAKTRKAWAQLLERLETEFGLGFVFLLQEPFSPDRITGAFNDIGCLVVTSAQYEAEELATRVQAILQNDHSEPVLNSAAYDIKPHLRSSEDGLRRLMSGRILQLVGGQVERAEETQAASFEAGV